MALSANIGDYAGRSVDLLMLEDAKAFGDALMSQTLAKPGQGGALTTGVQKFVQRFLLELFTEEGSMQYLPQRGCAFMSAARSGMWRTTNDVIASFNSALLTIKNNLLADERETDPDDEKFGSAELLTVSLTRDLVVMHLQLTTAAGEAREITYPLRTAVLGWRLRL